MWPWAWAWLWFMLGSADDIVRVVGFAVPPFPLVGGLTWRM